MLCEDTYRGGDDEIFSGRRSVPLQPSVVVELPAEILGVANVHAKRRLIIDGDNVRQCPHAASGSFDLSYW